MLIQLKRSRHYTLLQWVMGCGMCEQSTPSCELLALHEVLLSLEYVHVPHKDAWRKGGVDLQHKNVQGERERERKREEEIF